MKENNVFAVKEGEGRTDAIKTTWHLQSKWVESTSWEFSYVQELSFLVSFPWKGTREKNWWEENYPLLIKNSRLYLQRTLVPIPHCPPGLSGVTFTTHHKLAYHDLCLLSVLFPMGIQESTTLPVLLETSFWWARQERSREQQWVQRTSSVVWGSLHF